MQRAQQTIENFKKSVSKSMKLVGAAIAAIGVKKLLKDSLDFYDFLSTQESKLSTVMRQRMGANKAMVDSVKKLIATQEKYGVVAVEAQTAGAQELATYLDQASSLKTLIPVMNDLVAQQFGLNASSEQVATVATMVGKVMDGQLGALRRYGFTFTAAEEKIFKFGNESQRAALLASIVKDSIGSMNEALANTPQGRALQISFEFAGLQNEIGKTVSIFRDLMLPVLSKVISFATAAAVRLQQVGLFFNALFGRSAKSQTDANTAATVKQASAVGGLGKAIETAGKKAKQAGKDAKGSLASFDEINQLADKTKSGSDSASDSGTGGGGSAIDLGDPSQIDNDLPKLNEKLNALAEKIKGYFGSVKDFFKNVSSFISEHKDIIISSLAGIGAGILSYIIITNAAAITKKIWGSITLALDGLKAAFAFLISPVGLIVVAIAALTAAFVYFYRTNDKFRGFVDGILTKIKNIAVDLWNNALVPFGQFLKDIFVAAWNGLVTAIKSVIDWFSNLGSNLKDLKDNAIQKTKDVIEDFTQKIKDHETAIKATAITLGVIFGPALIKTGVEAAIAGGKLAAQFIANITKAGTEAVVTGAKLTVEFIGSIIKSGAEAVIAGAKLTASFIGAIIKAGVEAGVTAAVFTGKLIASTVSYAVEGWKAAASIGAQTAAWIANKAQLAISTGLLIAQKAATIASTAAQWALNAALTANPIGLVIVAIGALIAIGVLLYKNWDKVTEFAGKLWEGIKSAWNNIGTHTKKIWDGMIENVKGAINFIIGAINKMIEGMNGLKIKVPQVDIPLVGKVGGFDLGLPKIPTIPKLGVGGVTTGPTTALIGEAGQEAVLPLENNTGWMDVLADKIGSRMGGTGGSSGPIQIVLKVNEIELGRATAKSINKAQRVEGKLLLNI